MPVKKFKLSYQQLPEVFNLPPELYFAEIAQSIPKEASDQTEEQRTYMTNTIDQIDIDLDRSCYVDLEDETASSLKARWLTRNLDNKPSLTKGVFPFYTQGDFSSGSVAEVIHKSNLILSLAMSVNKTKAQANKDVESLMKINEAKHVISFAYKNALGQPAGFTLTACVKGDKDGNHKGWILSTTQNTTGSYQDRKVTVLSSTNYIAQQEQTMVAMDNSPSIEAELKEAINNDKVVELIKGIFNSDGSLNEEYLSQLSSRIALSTNIDDRDTKKAQLDCLFAWSKQSDNQELQSYVSSVKQQMNQDINFFEKKQFAIHLNGMLDTLAHALEQNSNTTKTASAIKVILNDVSKKVADLEQLAQSNYRQIELSHTYQAMANRLRSQALSFKFDGSDDDKHSIEQLTQFDVSRFSEKLTHFYNADPIIKKYDDDKKHAIQYTQKELTQLSNPIKQSYLNRYDLALGTGLIFGLFVGLIVAIALTGVLAPLSVALIATAAALATTGAVAGTEIVFINKRYPQEVEQYHNEVTTIRSKHEASLLRAEQNMQAGINLDSFFEAEKPKVLSQVEDQTPPQKPVINALERDAKTPATSSAGNNRFSFMAEPRNNSGVAIKKEEEVENGIEQPNETTFQSNNS